MTWNRPVRFLLDASAATAAQSPAAKLGPTTHDAMVTYDGRRLEFHYEPSGNRTVPSCRTSIPDLRNLRIFVDVGLVEIDADGGRACCTKRIDSPLVERVFASLSDDPDFEYMMIDGTIVWVHQHGVGVKRGSNSGDRLITWWSETLV